MDAANFTMQYIYTETKSTTIKRTHPPKCTPPPPIHTYKLPATPLPPHAHSFHSCILLILKCKNKSGASKLCDYITQCSRYVSIFTLSQYFHTTSVLSHYVSTATSVLSYYVSAFTLLHHDSLCILNSQARTSTRKPSAKNSKTCMLHLQAQFLV